MTLNGNMTLNCNTMKTNDIFDFRRFGKYFASDIRTCAANYGLSLATLSLLTPLAFHVIASAFSFTLGDGWNGPDMGFRAFVFAIAMFCLIVTMPVKCYGKITEKQYGSFWLTLPASRLEKFLSMIVLTCIITPAIGVGLYLGLDAIICAIDSTCGNSLGFGLTQLFEGLGNLDGALADVKMNLGNEGIIIDDGTEKMMQQIGSPWLYTVEIFCMTLPFLLGAIFFKSGKTVKTFLALAVFSTTLSIIATPFMMGYLSSLMVEMGDGVEAANKIINSGIMKNLVWINIVSDTLTIAALLTGIWFRIKTLKH